VRVSIRTLDDEADRGGFRSGVEALDLWLHQQAGQAVRKRLASVWIASREGQPEIVVGYYSLAPWQVAFQRCPEELKRRLPEYSIPMTLIARLAVAAEHQGQGLGGILLVDALNRAWSASKLVPVQAVLAHAKDERAAGFYRHHGFLPFPNERFHLFLPMESVGLLCCRL
jgi:GNAT superfamily N-acetyltransferase